LIVCAAVLWKSASAIANIAGRSARLILRLSNLFITTLLAPRLRRKPLVSFLTLKYVTSLTGQGATTSFTVNSGAPKVPCNLARGEGLAKPLEEGQTKAEPQRGVVTLVLSRRVAAGRISTVDTRGFAKPSPLAKLQSHLWCSNNDAVTLII